MNRMIVVLIATTLLLSGLPAHAQTGVNKPTCAAGDTVVWENTNTKVYHLPGDKYYGNTKHGAYTCRPAADTAGYHLAGKKATATPESAGSPAPAASDTPSTGHHHRHHNSGATTSPAPAPSPAAT